MTWEIAIYQIIIALITTSLGTIIGYLTTKKELETKITETEMKSKSEIDKIRETSESEINKIRENSKSELEKMTTEVENRIKEKIIESQIISQSNEETMKNEFVKGFLTQYQENPSVAIKNISNLQKLAQEINSKQSQKN